MDTRKIASEYRLAKWAQLMQERAATGASITAFCKRQGISRNTYFYWQRKLRQVTCEQASQSEPDALHTLPSGWAQLCIAENIEDAKSTLSIDIGGCRVTVDTDTNIDLLANVCRALMSLC